MAATTTSASAFHGSAAESGFVLRLGAESKSLGKSQVQCEVCGTSTIVDGESSLGARRQIRPRIERPQRCAINIRRRGRCDYSGAGRCYQQSWAIIEHGIAVQIIGRRDVKWRT